MENNYPVDRQTHAVFARFLRARHRNRFVARRILIVRSDARQSQMPGEPLHHQGVIAHPPFQSTPRRVPIGSR